MTVKIQILTLFYSFLFGIFSSFLLNLNKPLLFHKNLLIKITANIFIVLDLVLIYLIILYKINYGIVHHYFILMIFLGHFLANKKIKMLIKNVKSKFLVAKKKNK